MKRWFSYIWETLIGRWFPFKTTKTETRVVSDMTFQKDLKKERSFEDFCFKLPAGFRKPPISFKIIDPLESLVLSDKNKIKDLIKYAYHTKKTYENGQKLLSSELEREIYKHNGMLFPPLMPNQSKSDYRRKLIEYCVQNEVPLYALNLEHRNKITFKEKPRFIKKKVRF